MIDKAILKKAANALIPDARPTKGMSIFFNLSLLGLGSASIRSFQERVGGLWVGGELAIFQNRLQFRANAANNAVHSGDLSCEISMSQIRSVSWRPGIFTGSIEVIYGTNSDSHIKFRCFDSKKVAELLSDLSVKTTS